MAVLLSDETYENLMRIINKVDALSGDNVANDFHNIRIMSQRSAQIISQQPAATAAAKLPIGQYQGQVFSMVAQRQTGWEFPRLHPLI
jgi:hypothetical protein